MSSTGYIDAEGKYHRGEDKALPTQANSMHKQYRHDSDRRKNMREAIQPHKNGKPNPQFVRAYPEESKRYFSPDQIKQAEREL